jgi:hypothetical protein
LQAIRVSDRAIARQDKTNELREIIGIMEAEQWTQRSLYEIADSNNVRPLQEELQKVVSQSTEHLVLIYNGSSLNGGTNSLARGFADYGIPVIVVCEADHANPIESAGKVFQLSVAAMVASWDEVLCVSVPRSCARILLLRSADQNSFRLINHAHAMGWMTIYFPVQYTQQPSHDSEAEKYIVSNVEQVIAGSDSIKNSMQSIAAREVKVVSDSENEKSKVAEILALVSEALTESPVRLAIKGASYG